MLNRKTICLTIVLALSWFVSTGQIPSWYYTPATGLSGSALKAALHDIIDEHTALSYTATINALKVTDEDPGNTDNVILIYTGLSYPKSDYPDQWNREHTWAKSHGNFGDNPPEGTDLHHLRPCDVSVNTAKNNRDFSKGLTQYFDDGVPTGCYYSTYIWEPRDEDKGDVARMMFYMAVRYEGDNGETNLELVSYVNTAPDYEPLYGNLDTLIKWHNDDPVSDWEISRNDKIFNQYQANRNPFVDHPEYVELIWGDGISDEEEPVSHASDFTTSNITLSWTEPTTGILPDAYLIRKSTTGFESIPAPVDGIPVETGINNKNVAYGTGQFTFKNVTPGTTYFFKIFPYKGVGDIINYKTDGNIQQLTIQIN